MTEEQFKEKFKRNYLFAYTLIQSSGNDILGWLYRVLVVNDTLKIRKNDK
jgi:hypothetical protein